MISKLEDQISKSSLHQYCDQETFEAMKTKIEEFEEKTNNLNQQNLSQLNQVLMVINCNFS